MTEDTATRSTILTDVTMLSVIEALEAEDGAGVTAVADRLDLAKSTVHSHLQTLHDERYVVRRGDEYHLGMRFLDLGESARRRREEYTAAEEKVRELAAETEERAQFLVEEHGKGVYVYRSTGSHGVPTNSRIGQGLPIHSIAAGKAILAHLPEERIDSIVERHGLPDLTDNTIQDRSELDATLERIRERGYALNDEESWEGVRAVGVPVTTPDDEVLGGLSVSGSAHRFADDRLEAELVDLVLGAANEIELNIKYG